MARLIAVLALLAGLSGCAALKIQDDDHFLTKSTKVMGRIPLAVVTVGLSELVYACEREPDPAQCYQRVQDGLDQYYAEEARRREEARQQAALRNAIADGVADGIARSNRQRLPSLSSSVRCRTRYDGDTAYTTCH